MSILNVALSASEARVYVDTWSGEIRARPGAPAAERVSGESSKVFHVANSNALLAGRGSMGFFAVLTSRVMLRFGNGFDGLVDDLPLMLSDVRGQFQAAFAEHGFEGSPELAVEVCLVGWSEGAGQMAAYFFVLDHGAPCFEVLPMEPGESWVAPWVETWGAMPSAPFDAAQLAAAQVRLTKQEAPEVFIGGRLLEATVTRNTASIQVLAAL